MRQLGSGSHLESSKSYKSIDTPTINVPRTMISQSAPHTPVSVPIHPDSLYKSVPRLLSEPNVGAKAKSLSPGIKSMDSASKKSDKSSPFFVDKKLDNLDVNLDAVDGVKTLKSPSITVPIHSPKNLNKNNPKFFLKSPIIKRDTKIQLENNVKLESRKKSLDGTDV